MPINLGSGELPNQPMLNFHFVVFYNLTKNEDADVDTTIDSSFHVMCKYWSGLVWKKVLPMGLTTRSQSTAFPLCIMPPSDSREGLLFTTEKAFFCNIKK